MKTKLSSKPVFKRFLTIRGSKSISIRALLLAHLAKIQTGKSSKLTNLSDCEDVIVTQKALEQIASKSHANPNKFSPGKKDQINSDPNPTNSIDLRDCGTAFRFLTALKTATDSNFKITGSHRLLSRPIKDLEKAITTIQKKGQAKIRGNISSQFISAILLTYPPTDKSSNKTLRLKVTNPISSKPYVDMTIKLMKKFGIKVDTKVTKTQTRKFSIFTIKKGQKYQPANLKIEPDATSYSYITALAYLKKIAIHTLHTLAPKFPKSSLQGDTKFPKLIRKLPHKGENITLDLSDTPDLVPTLAILACIANGKTKIANIANLKFKESDRISALAKNLRKIGVRVKTGRSFIEITGNPRLPTELANRKQQIVIDPHGDHRIAMAFGILRASMTTGATANQQPSIKIKTPEVVKKSYPKFWQDIANLTANLGQHRRDNPSLASLGQHHLARSHRAETPR